MIYGVWMVENNGIEPSTSSLADGEFIDEILDVRKLWYGNQYREEVVNAKNIIEEEGSQL